jgi:hypothetical protein
MSRLLSALLLCPALALAAPLKEDLPPGAVARLGTPLAQTKETPRIGEVNALTFLDDKTLFVGTNGGWNTWDLEKRRPRQEKPVGGPVFVVANDSQRLFIGSIRKLHSVEPPLSATAEAARSWDAESHQVSVFALAPGGRRAVFNSGEQKLAILDVKLGNVTGTIDLASKPVAASLTANGRVLAVVTRDGAARVYNLDAAGKIDLAFTKRVARSDHVAAAFSPDGRLFAVSSAGRVTLVESVAGRPMLTLERRFGEGDVRCLAFSPDSRQIAVGRNGPEAAVRVHDVVAGPEGKVFEGHLGRTTFEGHLGDVIAVAFSPDGKTIASAGTDTSVLLWKAPPAGSAAKKMTAAEAWESLDSLDADVAYQCMEQLLADRTKTVPFLDERFKNQPAEQAQILRWIKELDHDEFRVREAARRGLIKSGLRAAPALTDPKRKPLGAEGEQRVRLILETYESQGLHIPESGLFGESLRMVRAVRILESFGSKEARQSLEAAAKGPAESRLAREAKAALEFWSPHEGK